VKAVKEFEPPPGTIMDRNKVLFHVVEIRRNGDNVEIKLINKATSIAAIAQNSFVLRILYSSVYIPCVF